MTVLWRRAQHIGGWCTPGITPLNSLAYGKGLPALEPRHYRRRLRPWRRVLGFVVKFDKAGGFIGREALLGTAASGACRGDLRAAATEGSQSR